METDYRTRANHLSHFVDDGCFRCHFTAMENERGERISSSCESCHSIVAQGPSADLETLAGDLNGLPSGHPVKIGQVWQTVKCTQCHTPASGH